MGNLEKAGVLVVVALLAVILVVAFMNNPEPGPSTQLDAHAKGLTAGAGDLVQKPTPSQPQEAPKTEPKVNTPPTDPNGDDVLHPRGGKKPVTQDGDRKVDDAAKGGQPQAKSDPKEHESGTPPTDPNGAGKGGKVESPPAPAAGSAYPKKVKVGAKDGSLWAIAVREYGAKTGPKMLKAIQAANPNVRPDAMKVGQELTLPAPPETAAAPEVAKTDATKPENSKTTSRAAAKKPAGTNENKPRHLPFTPH